MCFHQKRERENVEVPINEETKEDKQRTHLRIR